MFEAKQAFRTVAVTGCFDILHIGHVRLLQFAKSLGDRLIVGVNSDESVRALKGPTRPVNKLSQRCEMLKAMRWVDSVIPFSEENAATFLSTYRPAVWVKGADYTIDTLHPDEKAAVKAYEGRIVFAPLVTGESTSRILREALK